MSVTLDKILSFLDDSVEGDARSVVTPDAHREFIALSAGLADDLAGFYRSLDAHIGAQDVNLAGTGTSFQHENGFIKLSLRKLSDGRQLRLHIYPAGEYVDSRIHNHRWNLSSCILEGSLEGVNYAETESDSELTVDLHCLFDAQGAKKESVYVKTAGLKVSERYVCTAGQGHYLDADIFHKVKKPAGTRTVTLMLTGAPREEFSTIVEDRSFKPAKRSFFGKSNMQDAVRALVSG